MGDSKCSLLDLPPEILERILCLLHPNLERLVEFSQVCRLFRSVAYSIPVPVHIPLSEGRLELFRQRDIPVSTLANREPAVFVNDQIYVLNLRRLVTAELNYDDYLTNKPELDPHYVDLLTFLVKNSSQSLKELAVRLDLVSYHNGLFRCGEIVSQFRNLTFLSMAFNQQIEIQQKLYNRDEGQRLIKLLLENLGKLKNLYIFSCPTDSLVIHSESLERLHIYRSEFAGIQELKTPGLRKLMFHSNLREFFSKSRSGHDAESAKKNNKRLYEILYECPSLEYFNQCDLGVLKSHKLNRERWCHYANILIVSKYHELYGQAQEG